MDEISRQYEDDYFSWQSKIGKFGGKANSFKFKKYINRRDKVLDFGCGGGYLLSELECDLRVGLDINPVIESPPGVQIYKKYSDLVATFGAGFFDVVISNHALEHIENPAQALKECFEQLRPGGKIVIVVPSETHRIKYKPNDINHHIITFAPINLGNLLAITGFKVVSVRRLFHKWPPKYEKIAKLNWRIFHLTSFIYGAFKWSSIQLVGIGEKTLDAPTHKK
jgi:2-polyprenyl-3-methyl-5-hydroxy-6-metoxy-1,4-benzoquinol methylase